MRGLIGLGVCVLMAPYSMSAEPPPAKEALRPPAMPLVASNPYFNTWCRADKLTDDWAKHWTGGVMPLCGLIRVDGKAYRWAGTRPEKLEVARQVEAFYTATRTDYAFEAGGVRLQVSFLSPLLMSDPDLASFPVTFITTSVRATDGREHDAAVYLDTSAEWCVHDPSQQVQWSRMRAGGMEVLRIGTADQPVLKRAGDYTRIDWGYFNLAARRDNAVTTAMAGHEACRGAFVSDGSSPTADDFRQPRAASDDWPVLSVAANLGKVGTQAKAETFTVAYDDRYSIEYFGRKLRPYWARSGKDFGTMLAQVVGDHDKIAAACKAFDQSLRERLVRAGGEKYADICTLVYRHSLAAHGMAADFDGSMLMFAKENSSNGCIGTVDVIFPTCPIFLALSPEMLNANLRPVMDYAASPRWKFSFAPHDLGTYPLANGQVYGGGERTEEDQMPVEETANMVLMLAALAQQDGNADFASGPANKWWPTVTKWAEYLRDNGLDPANQLCTDDFTGHLAHNANLAVKAICGIGGYAKMCEMRHESDKAAEWRGIAQKYAGKWRELAAGGEGGHTVLAYGQNGTWSLKYNMIWDNLLALGLFPDELKKSEVAFYRSELGKYSVPMDNRAEFTKPEWVTWAACLTGERVDFEAMFNPIWDFANQTRDRLPLSDWFGTSDARNKGFHARTVVGGMYMPLVLEGQRGK